MTVLRGGQDDVEQDGYHGQYFKAHLTRITTESGNTI